ncbi:MAG: LacI family transcriptional regulator [Propionibacteriaceae bacterium]|jgi:DNA-binding LacI/PurR family transcriptional regulator|nr:LacI family transcriptional regulator [Propionibacteriaceae bacterium]
MKIDDVAAALGISKGTVSRAITGHGRIAPATRQRVLDYMTAHDFHPNTIAQSLSRRKTMNIAFTVPSARELTQLPFFLQCLVGVRRQAVAHAYDTLVVDNTYADVQRVVSQQKVDGVIVSRNLVGSRLLGYLAGTGLPFVLIGTTPRADVIQIDHDHRTACRELTTRLLDQWSGTPGLIAGSGAHLVTRARAKGFRDGAPGAPIAWGATDERSVVTAFRALRDQGVDLVFCEDDMICGCLESNLRTGRLGTKRDTLRVASFYDSPLLEALNPDVPVLRFDADDLGAQAATLLLARLSGQTVQNMCLSYAIITDRSDRKAVPSLLKGNKE